MANKMLDKIIEVERIIEALDRAAGDRAGGGYTSYTIAQWSGYSHSTVYRILKAAVAMRCITFDKKQHKGMECKFYRKVRGLGETIAEMPVYS